MSKVLITGGLGQIGSYIVERLCNEHEVTVIDNFSSTVKEEVPDGVMVIRADVQDRCVRDVVCNNDVIIHAAAQVSVEKSTQDPIHDAENNVIGTLNLLEAARQADIKRFVYLSSAAVYGNPTYLPIDEEHPQNPLSPYGVSKLSAEKYCVAYNRAFGLPTVCLRVFNVYSPRQSPQNPYSGVISTFIERVVDDKPPVIFGDGSQTRDFVSVHDIVDMVCLVMEKDEAAGEVFNVGTGIVTRIDDLAIKTIKLFGKDLVPQYTEPRRGDIVDSYTDISKARETGYSPKVMLDEGLKEFLP
ncbi:MAG: NAD-dependent epimerase/dehydratase family protein [Halobacteriota archaeon]|nr:NAD-dependent epimerase/dehydratase family protein [Halobacteriota archaeon]